MYGLSAWNLLHVTLLAPTVLKWLIDFWKTGVPHFKVQFIDFSVRLEHVKKKRARHCFNHANLPPKFCFVTEL
jgi:hypothetical protein